MLAVDARYVPWTPNVAAGDRDLSYNVGTVRVGVGALFGVKLAVRFSAKGHDHDDLAVKVDAVVVGDGSESDMI